MVYMQVIIHWQSRRSFCIYAKRYVTLTWKQVTVKACDGGGDCLTFVETLWLLSLGQIRLAAVDRMRVRGTVIIIQFLTIFSSPFFVVPTVHLLHQFASN